MWQKIGQIGITGFISIVVMFCFAFMVVASLANIQGVRPLTPETTQAVHTTLLNLVVGLGGVALGVLKGSSDVGSGPTGGASAGSA